MLAGFPLEVEFSISGYQAKGRIETPDVGEPDWYTFHINGSFHHTGHLSVSGVGEIKHEGHVLMLLTVHDGGLILLPSPGAFASGAHAPIWRLPSQECVALVPSLFVTAEPALEIPEVTPPLAWHYTASLLQSMCE